MSLSLLEPHRVINLKTQYKVEKTKYYVNLLVNKSFKKQYLLFSHREKYKQVDKIQHN